MPQGSGTGVQAPAGRAREAPWDTVPFPAGEEIGGSDPPSPHNRQPSQVAQQSLVKASARMGTSPLGLSPGNYHFKQTASRVCRVSLQLLFLRMAPSLPSERCAGAELKLVLSPTNIGSSSSIGMGNF